MLFKNIGQRPALCHQPFNSITWVMVLLFTLEQSYFRHYVTEVSGSPVHCVGPVQCLVCFVSAGGGRSASHLCFTCPKVSRTWRSSISPFPNQGHVSQPFDHQLCLFSPAALRDRCKCSSNLDAPTETSPAALHLFITLRSASHLLLLALFHLVPSRTSFIILACSFFTPPLRSFRDVNKSDNRGC